MASVITHGYTTPRIFTQPRVSGPAGACGCGCALSPATSRGFEAVAFAEQVLRVQLIPWERWLLIHMLEVNDDGTLRFRKALVIVARQNGKTLVAAILAAFFLYVDSARWPGIVNPRDFVIVGAAQKLDIAKKPWTQVRQWGCPDDLKVGIAYDRVPLLQAVTHPPREVNGEFEIVTHERAVYRPRTFVGARGATTARLILDELREQYNYEGWSAIEKTSTAMFDSMLIAFSNAGTYRSVVLRDVRDIAHDSVKDADAEWFIAEWSAEQDAELNDPEAFAQANPSAGYLPGMTIANLMRTARNAKNKSVERIEVLCQWVTQGVEPYIEPVDWKALQVEPSELRIPKGARTVWSVDTSSDRSTTWVGAAVLTEDGRPFATVRTKRAGIVWAVEYLAELARESGQREVALQAQGCPVVELIPLLEALKDDKGRPLLTLHKLDRPTCAIATGQIHDHVRDERLVLTEQPDVDIAIEGGLATKYAENRLWSREASRPVDIAGVVTETLALYALTNIDPPAKKSPPPPPRAAVLDPPAEASSGEPSLLSASF